MLALQKALRELGTDVVNNRLDASVDVHICNAIWFDPQLERHLADRQPCRIIHRLDGLVHLARSSPDRSADDRAYDFNRRFAAATVLQSDWCLRQAVENGYSPTRPVIIRNASDPAIFSPPRRVQRGPRTRIIATSWSDNPLKGAALYRAMESRIDWTRFEFTYVGRTSVAFDRIRVIPPVPSKRLAELLREHDIYITASRNEACSNALIEALSCGLPALYLNHAGNPEVVGYGGLPFADEIEAEQQLIRLTTSLEGFRNCIHLDSLQATATRYLELAAELMKA
jgi:glycosyltransferase involved in cell wall biosynthesis